MQTQTQTQEILSWFGPRDLRPVPKQPALDFSYLDFVHPKSTSCTLLDKTTSVKSVQLFSIPRRQQLVQLLFYTKKNSCTTLLFG